jgi:flavin reductase (DIM6/NTAB) family NADH-FMN oxidoreductase RutF
VEKIKVDVSKLFIPHPMQLFIFGTYKEDGEANLGLFCWLNFCWDDELSVMACIDGNKLTLNSYFGLEKKGNLGDWK